MTRFIMTLKEAVSLVMESVFLAHGGEVFVTKMPIARIDDLAKALINVLAPAHGFDPDDIKIDVIGAKAGEKLYEELMNDEETRRTVELDRYFSILPAFKAVYQDIQYVYSGMGQLGITRPYNSAIETPMTADELRSYMVQHKLL